MRYPDHETYRKLYAKYMDKRPASELVDLAGDLTDKVVVDLCCGEGEITKICFERGARQAYMVDSEPGMIDAEYFIDMGYPLEICETDVAVFLCNFCQSGLPPLADVVFCRQAVNYWFASKMADNLPCMVKPGGRFVFNTFNGRPDGTPAVKEYEHNGFRFVEVHWLVPDQNGSGIDMVHHVQIRNGLPSHATQFAWISRSEFHTRLVKMGFLVEEIIDGNTSIYICKRT